MPPAMLKPRPTVTDTQPATLHIRNDKSTTYGMVNYVNWANHQLSYSTAEATYELRRRSLNRTPVNHLVNPIIKSQSIFTDDIYFDFLTYVDWKRSLGDHECPGCKTVCTKDLDSLRLSWTIDLSQN